MARGKLLIFLLGGKPDKLEMASVSQSNLSLRELKIAMGEGTNKKIIVTCQLHFPLVEVIPFLYPSKNTSILMYLLLQQCTSWGH